MKLLQRGDVQIISNRHIMPKRDDFMLLEIHCMCLAAQDGIVVLLSGVDKILIKLWPNKENEGTPTILSTGLDWKTFSQDDNILIMIKNSGIKSMPTISILITKKYHT